MHYTEDDVLVLAKRHHNIKRTYLLVNPLQAKHLPVSPSRSLEMMTCLGEQIKRKYPSARLVIGFAETATAIAATVASCLYADCKYIHTTRESYDDLSDWIFFNEEHSHAVEQKLCTKELAQWISASSQIIFVDDEISTGKTLLNIIEQLTAAFPEVKSKEIITASIINRLSTEHETRFRNAGIKSEYLVKLNNEDYSSAVANFNITPGKPIKASTSVYEDCILRLQKSLIDPRVGVSISDYQRSCQTAAEEILQYVSDKVLPGANILVLGTEECMYPALVFGQKLESLGSAVCVKCHATTRSPIGVCNDPAYPIRSGYKLHSFYDKERDAYVYNLASYDMAVIITDTRDNDSAARREISEVLRIYGCQKTLFVEGGKRV